MLLVCIIDIFFCNFYIKECIMIEGCSLMVVKKYTSYYFQFSILTWTLHYG